MPRNNPLLNARLLALCGGVFVTVAAVTWAVLTQMVPYSYVSKGVLEVGYFNPRDYLPHPVVSTQGMAALIGDPTFALKVTALLGRDPPAALDFRAAPLEEGLMRIEARSSDPLIAQRGAALACSLVAARTNEPFQSERDLSDRQLGALRPRVALAETLAARSRSDEARAIALRALAHFTEVQIKAELEAELVAQKKQTRVLVEPSRGTAERSSVILMAMGPAAVVTAIVVAGLVARSTRRRERAA